jgi:hypothetical protein
MKNFRETTNYRATKSIINKDVTIQKNDGIQAIGKASNLGYISKQQFIDFINGNVDFNNDTTKHIKAISAICDCDFKFTFKIALSDNATHKTKGIELTKADLFTYCYISNAKCTIENKIATIETCFYNHLYALNSTNKTSKNGFFDNISMYGKVVECIGTAYAHDNHANVLKECNAKYKDVIKYLQNWNDLRGFNSAKVTDRKTIVNFR